MATGAGANANDLRQLLTLRSRREIQEVITRATSGDRLPRFIAIIQNIEDGRTSSAPDMSTRLAIALHSILVLCLTQITKVKVSFLNDSEGLSANCSQRNAAHHNVSTYILDATHPWALLIPCLWIMKHRRRIGTPLLGMIAEDISSLTTAVDRALINLA